LKKKALSIAILSIILMSMMFSGIPIVSAKVWETKPLDTKEKPVEKYHLIAQFPIIAQGQKEEKNYTFTIYVDVHSKLGHAFVKVSDGTVAGTNVSGFYGKPPLISGILWGLHIPAAIENDNSLICEHDAAITWIITKEQYDKLQAEIRNRKQEVADGTLKYNLYSARGMFSCISYATSLAELVGLKVPEYIRGGRLPASLGVPDPKALYNSLRELFGKPWDNATIELHTPTGTITPKNAGSPSRFIDTGIQSPSGLASELNITLEQQYLPPKSGRTGQSILNIIPYTPVDPNRSFVFWDFGDAYTGVIGSPFNSSFNQEVNHSFETPGTYEGTVLVIDETGMYHFTFITEITGGWGGIVVPVDKFALLAPYIALASTILVATVATAIYVKRVKCRKTQ